MPTYEHDCKHCVFLETTQVVVYLDQPPQDVDWYRTCENALLSIVLGRYGNDGPEYATYSVDMLIGCPRLGSEWAEVNEAARIANKHPQLLALLEAKKEQQAKDKAAWEAQWAKVDEAKKSGDAEALDKAYDALFATA
jgi:hypothetical protein